MRAALTLPGNQGSKQQLYKNFSVKTNIYI